MPGTDPWPLLNPAGPWAVSQKAIQIPASPSHVDFIVLHAVNAQSVFSLCPCLTHARSLGSCQTKGRRTAEHLGWSGLAGPRLSEAEPPRDWLGWALSPGGTWTWLPESLLDVCVAAGRAPEPDKGPAGAFPNKGSQRRPLLSRLNTPNAFQAPLADCWAIHEARGGGNYSTKWGGRRLCLPLATQRQIHLF